MDRIQVAGKRLIALGLLAMAPLWAQARVTVMNEADARKLVKTKVDPDYPPAARAKPVVVRGMIDSHSTTSRSWNRRPTSW